MVPQSKPFYFTEVTKYVQKLRGVNFGSQNRPGLCIQAHLLGLSVFCLELSDNYIVRRNLVWQTS